MIGPTTRPRLVSPAMQSILLRSETLTDHVRSDYRVCQNRAPAINLELLAERIILETSMHAALQIFAFSTPTPGKWNLPESESATSPYAAKVVVSHKCAHDSLESFLRSRRRGTLFLVHFRTPPHDVRDCPSPQEDRFSSSDVAARPSGSASALEKEILRSRYSGNTKDLSRVWIAELSGSKPRIPVPPPLGSCCSQRSALGFNCVGSARMFLCA